MDGEFTLTVIPDADEEVEPVAIPWDSHSLGLPSVDKGQRRTTHNGARGVSNLTGGRAPGGRRFHELDVQFSEPRQGSWILPQAGKSSNDRFERPAALLVGDHS